MATQMAYTTNLPHPPKKRFLSDFRFILLSRNVLWLPLIA